MTSHHWCLGSELTREDLLCVVLPAERALDQPAALLQRRQEVSLALIDDVYNLERRQLPVT